MQKPEIPKNDDRRIEALEALDILDKAAEDQLDFIIKIVKERFNAPIALISLVDKNRQWFMSKQGLSANETSRDISFCGHAILNPGIFEITNAIEDSRFEDNPLVLGPPYIRFYAGVPITTVDGYRIGTLCIIDTKARKLSLPEKEELQNFAHLVQSYLIKIDQAKIAFYDPLTKLANRRLLEDHINQALSANRRAYSYSALLYLDLDNFKSLNDTNGHEAGDLLLIEVAKRLKFCLREVDTISRIGGDEFSVLITDLGADEAVAKEYALLISEKIRLALVEPYKLAMQSQSDDVILIHYCPASIGITLFSSTQKSQHEILKEADAAMYEAKHAGRNSVRLYQPS